MPKTNKTSDERVAEKDAKILQLQKEKRKILLAEKKKERKERDHRLYRRHGLLGTPIQIGRAYKVPRMYIWNTFFANYR